MQPNFPGTPQYYNTLEGIKESLLSYPTFIKMLHDRQHAGYILKQSLNTFLILGRYQLDSCGNVGQLKREGFVPLPTLESVLKWDDFISLLHPDKDIVTIYFDNSIPPLDVHCTVCYKQWDVTTCHDSLKRKETIKEKISKESICRLGEKVKDAKIRFESFTNGEYRIRDYITNEKYANKTPRKDYPSLQENELGIKHIDDNYEFEENDVYFLDVHKFFHKECLLKKTMSECITHLNDNGKKYKMGNLAGVFECDPFVELELKLAGIKIFKKEITSEVPTTFYGRLNGFIFHRAWYYWIVEGLVPLNLAIELYENPIGRKTVRVEGHCGCPSPIEFGIQKYLNTKTNKFEEFISTYHIDSIEGLKLFTKTIKTIKTELYESKLWRLIE